MKGTCFDATSSNTGRKHGACVLEQKLDIELLHFACRHQFLEIVLEELFSACIRPSSGPTYCYSSDFNVNSSLLRKKTLRVLSCMNECTRIEAQDISEKKFHFRGSSYKMINIEIITKNSWS